jgi:translation initiation factor IF-3
VGIISTSQGLALARQRGLDLVEISPTAQPPVCRVMDYGKYKYELAKKEKSARQSQSHVRVKEVKFHANTDTNDYEFKVRQIRGFIEEGHRVKISLMFRGREQAHQELGYDLMRRVVKACEDVCTSDRTPQAMGRILVQMLTPRAGAIKAPSAPAAKPASPPAGSPATPPPAAPPRSSPPGGPR